MWLQPAHHDGCVHAIKTEGGRASCRVGATNSVLWWHSKKTHWYRLQESLYGTSNNGCIGIQNVAWFYDSWSWNVSQLLLSCDCVIPSLNRNYNVHSYHPSSHFFCMLVATNLPHFQASHVSVLQFAFNIIHRSRRVAKCGEGLGTLITRCGTKVDIWRTVPEYKYVQ